MRLRQILVVHVNIGWQLIATNKRNARRYFGLIIYITSAEEFNQVALLIVYTVLKKAERNVEVADHAKRVAKRNLRSNRPKKPA